jgi:hypothetical protein
MSRKDRILKQWSVTILLIVTLFSSSAFAKYSGGPYTLKDCDLNCDGVFNVTDHYLYQPVYYK